VVSVICWVMGHTHVSAGWLHHTETEGILLGMKWSSTNYYQAPG
jgi:hypothetical protein